MLTENFINILQRFCQRYMLNNTSPQLDRRKGKHGVRIGGQWQMSWYNLSHWVYKDFVGSQN